MESKTTDQSTNHTPGSAPGSGSGAAPMSGEPTPKTAGSSEFGASSGSSSSDASGSPSDVSFRGNTGGSSSAGSSSNTSSSSSFGGTSGLKNTIADRLEAGADMVRSRGGNMGLSGATGDGSIGIGEEGKLAHMGGVVADSMKAAASWVREADVDGIKDGLEKQVKEHPARSLLVAVGVGYLLGKAFRR